MIKKFSSGLIRTKNKQMNKRAFIKNISALGFGATLTFPQISGAFGKNFSFDKDTLASNEEFWEIIRGGYKLKPDYINLENGYYCFLPQEILEAYINHIREVNYQGSYYMRTVQWENKNKSAALLAGTFGCKPSELVITRNTTESLDLIISGYPWQKGDEAIVGAQEYGSMISMFKMAEKRFGIKKIEVSVPNHPLDDEEIVNIYERAITSKTKLLLVSHIINITGQILPIKKICDMAHSKNVEVMVDGAHAIAHFPFRIDELNCDYYGSSLHKWLSVPLGAGLLFVKEEKIKNFWPLLAPFDIDKTDISYLNHIGTHPVATDLAIVNAIDYYKKIGPERKAARLNYLKNYWVDQVKNTEGIVINTPLGNQKSCGIANVGLTHFTPSEMADQLMKKYNIYTVAIDGAGVRGCRITPNLYTRLDELDQFVYALKELAKAGKT
jgi:selenocysteine lyase/cysteine desulfurase